MKTSERAVKPSSLRITFSICNLWFLNLSVHFFASFKLKLELLENIMTKSKINKPKLSLNKETIKMLNSEEAAKVAGGKLNKPTSTCSKACQKKTL